jgi:drug/metabolite transporter (DMT)-like permease
LTSKGFVSASPVLLRARRLSVCNTQLQQALSPNYQIAHSFGEYQQNIGNMAESSKQETQVAIVALVILFVIWSNSFHAIAYFRQTLKVSAMDLTILRYGPVVPFCLAYVLRDWRKSWHLLRVAWLRIIVMGSLTVSGYNLALNWGQGRVPPATASLIIALNPVFTYLMAMGFLGEKREGRKFIGFAIAFLGIYLLVSSQATAYGPGYSLSALVVLLAPLSWATATVTGKPLTARTDPLLLTFLALGIGSLPYLFGLIAGTGEVHETLATMNLTGWLALIHLSLPCTIIGFAIWFWALKRLPASTAAAFVFLNPPLTTLFGAVWGTETWHWSTAAFGSLTLAGVALSSGLLRRGIPKSPPV